MIYRILVRTKVISFVRYSRYNYVYKFKITNKLPIDNQEPEDALIESDNESYNRPLSDHETNELFMNQESDVRSVETIDDGDHEFNNILNDNEPNDIGIEENVPAANVDDGPLLENIGIYIIYCFILSY